METNARLIVYDSKNKVLVEAKNEHEYLDIFMRSFGKKNLAFGLKVLASNYMATRQFLEAENIYETLFDHADKNEVYALLAQVEYEKMQYENAKVLLNKINFEQASAELLKQAAQLYLNLKVPATALQLIEWSKNKSVPTSSDYLLLAQIYEVNYAEQPTMTKWMNEAVDHYYRFFQYRFEIRKKNGFYFYEQQDNYLPHAITYLLMNNKISAALALIDSFFEWFTLPDNLQLTETIAAKVKLEDTPYMIRLDEQKEYDRYNEIYREMKASVHDFYSRLVPLLLELKAFAHYELEQWSEADKAIHNVFKFSTGSPQVDYLKAAIQAQVPSSKINAVNYQSFIHDTLVPLNYWHAKELRIEQDSIFEKVKDFLDKKYEEMSDTEKEKLFELFSYYLGQSWRPYLKSDDVIRETVVEALQQAKERLMIELTDINDPIIHYEDINFIEVYLWPSRCEKVVNGQSEKYKEKASLDLSRIQNISELWLASEKYFDLLASFMTKDTKVASLMIMGYFKVLEVWLVKLLGEICTNTRMLDMHKNQVKVGSWIQYYTKTTLGSYGNFVTNYHSIETNWPNLHPVKSNRKNRIDLLDKRFKSFQDKRNEISHKAEYSFEEVEKVREEFYELVVLLMDILRLPVKQSTNSRSKK